MPRRPRRSHRAAQSTTPQHENAQQSRAQIAKRARLKVINSLSESDDAEPAHSTKAHPHEAHNGSSDDDDINGGSDGDEEDLDAPRVVQWIDDEQMDGAAASQDPDGVEDGASEAGPSRRLQSLEDDLSTLPLGTLRTAQRSLSRAQALSDTESRSEEQSKGESSASEDDDLFPRPVKGQNKEKSDLRSDSQSVLAKRMNKHAPIETTSKRPVSRRRVVVDDRLPKPRDPRFMHVAGRYNSSRFKQQYNFLSGLHIDERLALREHTKRARKLLANSPSHLRAEREEEVKRLELAMKRAESAVNLDNRERVELEALQSVKRTEKEKRNQGKAGWWMKRSEKKELLEKARLDAIALAGGKQAVRKAVEKKRKKVNQKEKKMRPFPRSQDIGWSDGKKRRRAGSIASGRGVKRRKVVSL